ncbi:hypothetical protein, partial [Lichenihabitans psoromatis]|uniref:hypothetical protein n=1 Tax=Lichenihabitans psoromatis TaxID=2528642 RepID=UPI0010383364
MSTLSSIFSTTFAIAAILATTTGNVRAAEASATISAYPCSAVDPELYTHQRWITGSTPYGIAVEQWDQAAFDALKQRMTACMTSSNRQRTLMMLNYLEGPYSPQAQVLRQLDTSNTKAAQRAAFVTELKTEMASAAADTTPRSRRNRLTTLSSKIDLSTLPADQKMDLRRLLTQRIKEAAERDAAAAVAAEQVAQQQRAAETEAADAENVKSLPSA